MLRSERTGVIRATDGFRLTSPEPAAKRSREKSPRKPSDQSKRSKSGTKGEHILAAYHKVCAAEGVAYIDKIATPMQIRGPGFKMGKMGFVIPCVHGKKAGVDFRGNMADGTAVYIEAKNVTGAEDKFYLRDVRDVQREQLDAKLKQHCVCVLVVIRAGHVYALPWSIARRHVALGDAELADWYVRPGTAYLARWSQ